MTFKCHNMVISDETVMLLLSVIDNNRPKYLVLTVCKTYPS